MSKQLKRSRLITERLIECSQNGELDQGDELRIVGYLFNRLQLLPIADAAKRAGISYNGMKQRLEQGKEMWLQVGSYKFVSK